MSLRHYLTGAVWIGLIVAILIAFGPADTLGNVYATGLAFAAVIATTYILDRITK